MIRQAIRTEKKFRGNFPLMAMLDNRRMKSCFNPICIAFLSGGWVAMAESPPPLVQIPRFTGSKMKKM